MRTGLRLALARPRFRLLCLGLLGLPFLFFYIRAAVLTPWALPTQLDFRPNWTSALQIARGRSPYPPAVLEGRWKDVVGVPYVYPPLVAWLSQPLTLVTYETAARLWLVIQQAAILVLSVLLGRLLHLRRADHWLLLVIAIFSSTLLAGDIQIGQLNLLITALLACWLVMLLKPGNGAFAPLALTIAAKLYPAPLLIPSLIRGRWRRVVEVVGLCAALTLITPVISLQYFLRVLPHVTGATDISQNTALSATAVRLFHPPPVVVTAIWVLALATVLGVSAVTIRRLGTDRDSRLLEVLVMVSATPFVSPLMEYGHLVPLVLVAMLAAPMAWARRQHLALGLIVVGWSVISYRHFWYGAWGSWDWGIHAWESSGGIAAAILFAGVVMVARSRQAETGDVHAPTEQQRNLLAVRPPA